MIYLNIGSSSSQAIYKSTYMLFKTYDISKASHAYLNAKLWT